MSCYRFRTGGSSEAGTRRWHSGKAHRLCRAEQRRWGGWPRRARVSPGKNCRPLLFVMRNCLDGAGPRGEKCRCTQDRPQGHLFGRSIAAAAATAIPSPAATLTGTSAATAVAAPAAAATVSRFGLINRQSPALDLFAVKRLDGRLGLRKCPIPDERPKLSLELLRPARRPAQGNDRNHTVQRMEPAHARC